MIPTVRRFSAMGSDCEVRLHAATEAAGWRASVAAEGEIRRIEARFSRYRIDSELSRINRVADEGGGTDVDAETAFLIAHAVSCYVSSDGAFDITSGLLRALWDFSGSRLPEQQAIDQLLPRIGMDKVTLSHRRLTFARSGMALDFGGLGKEYAADAAAEMCSRFGIRHGFVNLAGDIRVIGPQPDGSPWRIGVRDPRDSDALIAAVVLGRGALATSGDYERFIEVGGRRYCHILDPRTGWSAHGLSSVTVMAPRCLIAGSLSTAAMVKGHCGRAWLRGQGVRHIVVDDQGACAGTEALGLYTNGPGAFPG